MATKKGKAKAAKEETPAKAEYTSHKDALAAKSDVTKKLGAARSAMEEFVKKAKLKKEKNPGDHPTHGAAYKKLEESVKALEAERVEIVNALKKLKGTPEAKTKKGPSKGGESKYDAFYPEGLKNAANQSEEKKKFRARIRSGAKAAKMDVDDFLKDPAKVKEFLAKPVEKRGFGKAKKKEEPETEKKTDKKAKAEKPEKKVEKKAEAPAPKAGKKLGKLVKLKKSAED